MMTHPWTAEEQAEWKLEWMDHDIVQADHAREKDTAESEEGKTESEEGTTETEEGTTESEGDKTESLVSVLGVCPHDEIRQYASSSAHFAP